MGGEPFEGGYKYKEYEVILGGGELGLLHSQTKLLPSLV